MCDNPHNVLICFFIYIENNKRHVGYLLINTGNCWSYWRFFGTQWRGSLKVKNKKKWKTYSNKFPNVTKSELFTITVSFIYLITYYSSELSFQNTIRCGILVSLFYFYTSNVCIVCLVEVKNSYRKCFNYKLF